MSKEELSTKMRIVDRSVALFKEFGFQNVSVSKICKSLGITRSAFYYHFKTKDEIFDYFFLTSELYITEELFPVLEASNYRSQFFMIFNLYAQRIVDAGPEIISFVLKRNVDAYVHNIAPQDIPMWQTYVFLIKKAQEMGEVSSKLDPESTVEVIIYLANGIGLTWCNKKGGFDYIQECKRMIENILKC